MRASFGVLVCVCVCVSVRVWETIKTPCTGRALRSLTDHFGFHLGAVHYFLLDGDRRRNPIGRWRDDRPAARTHRRPLLFDTAAPISAGENILANHRHSRKTHLIVAVVVVVVVVAGDVLGST